MTSVKIDTSLGELTIELDETAAPETAQNFIKYVEKNSMTAPSSIELSTDL